MENKPPAVSMYSAVRRGGKTRGRWGPLIAGILATVAVCAAVIGLFVFGGWYQVRFREFVSDLSDNTVCAYEHGGLRADLDGRALEIVGASEPLSLRVKGDELYDIYRVIVQAGAGRLLDAPERAPDIVLTYGDSARLELWEVRMEYPNQTPAREYGLLLRYCGADGRVYCYDTDQLALAFITRSLSPSAHERWDGGK